VAVNAADISVAVTGDIRYTGTTANYTVLELHRYLQDLADNASSTGDDLLDITDTTPSERSTDNVITLNSPYNIDDDLAEHLYDGSISQDNGDVLYAGLVVVGSVVSGTQLMLLQNEALLTNYWGTGINADAANNILLRMLVKIRDAGDDIDGRRLLVMARELSDTYSEFSVTMGLGNSVAAVFTSEDLNNQTAGSTIATWDITNTEGLALIDVNNDGTDEQYYSEWDLGTRTEINDLYEFTKYLQRRGSASTIYGVNGQLFRGVTHSFAYDTESGGPFTQNETLEFGNGARAILLALDDLGANGYMYVQLTSGAVPGDDATITGGLSSATAAINGTVTARSVSPAFVGISTGSSLIGAYGVGVTSADLSASDKLFDLSNTLRVPPNNVTFVVSGLVSGEDRVLVGPESGGVLAQDQLTLSGAHSSGTTITVTAAIPSDTPSFGTIRVEDEDGVYRRYEYTSWTGSVFTLSGSVGYVHPDASDVWISYIDDVASATSESFTSVYLSNRSLFIRVRDGGATPIKTFETTSVLGSAGGSTTVIRTSDL